MTGVGRKLLAEACHRRYHQIRVVEKFPLSDGGEFALEFADPGLLLSELVAESDALSKLYQAAFEYTPGAKLKVDNRRKAMNLYFTFVNLGQAAMSDDAAWVVPLVIRHSMLQRIVGGWPRVLRAFLRRLMLGPHGLATTGLALRLGDETFVIRARLSNVLSDGEGLKVAFDWKGSSGLKPCIKHYNVFKKGSDLAHRRPGYCEVTCADATCFLTWLQKDMSASMALLNAAKKRVDEGMLPKARLDELEMSVGFNANTHSVWVDSDLTAACEIDFVSCVTYDWVHNFLQDGTFTAEVYIFLQRCEPLGISSDDVNLFLKHESWRWPAVSTSKSKSLHRVFDAYRSSSSATADKLKCSASELLGLYGMLRHFVEVKVGSRVEVHLERLSFDAACQVLDVLLLCKRGVVDVENGASALQDAVCNHLKLHVAAYGDQYIRPKHHWMLDIGPQFLRDRCILDAFVIERGICW